MINIGGPQIDRAPSPPSEVAGQQAQLEWTSTIDPSSKAPRVGRHHRLRPMLSALDALAVALGWSTVLVISRPDDVTTVLAVVPVLTALTIGSFMAQHLYRSRVCVLRVDEFTKLAHGAAIPALAAVAVGPKLGLPYHFGSPRPEAPPSF